LIVRQPSTGRRPPRELRAGFEIAGGAVLTGKVVADIKRAAGEELARVTDPSHVLRGMQSLFDVFWRLKRCPVMLVLTAEVSLPQLPDVELGLAILLERRMRSAGVTASLQDVLEHQGLQLLSQSYLESVTNGQAGDLRRTLAIMRAALDVALSEPTAQIVSTGHVQEAIARTPVTPSSALS
jgi:hypothetical protein